jgi:hypothetical protein
LETARESFGPSGDKSARLLSLVDAAIQAFKIRREGFGNSRVRRESVGISRSDFRGSAASSAARLKQLDRASRSVVQAHWNNRGCALFWRSNRRLLAPLLQAGPLPGSAFRFDSKIEMAIQGTGMLFFPRG